MIFIKAFLVGGLICVVGQILLDLTKLTPARILVTYVVSGVFLTAIGVYEPLVKFAGAGAFVPISSFGNTLVTAAIKEATEVGFIGLFSGLLKTVSAGVSSAIVFGFFAAMIFKPKG